MRQPGSLNQLRGKIRAPVRPAEEHMLIVEFELHEIVAIIAGLRGAVETSLQVRSLDVQCGAQVKSG